MSCVWVFAVCTVMLSIMWQHTRLNTRVGLTITKSTSKFAAGRPSRSRALSSVEICSIADLFVFAVGPRSRSRKRPCILVLCLFGRPSLALRRCAEPERAAAEVCVSTRHTEAASDTVTCACSFSSGSRQRCRAQLKRPPCPSPAPRFGARASGSAGAAPGRAAVGRSPSTRSPSRAALGPSLRAQSR